MTARGPTAAQRDVDGAWSHQTDARLDLAESTAATIKARDYNLLLCVASKLKAFGQGAFERPESLQGDVAA